MIFTVILNLQCARVVPFIIVVNAEDFLYKIVLISVLLPLKGRGVLRYVMSCFIQYKLVKLTSQPLKLSLLMLYSPAVSPTAPS